MFLHIFSVVHKGLVASGCWCLDATCKLCLQASVVCRLGLSTDLAYTNEPVRVLISLQCSGG